jgi:hypothetical protein
LVSGRNEGGREEIGGEGEREEGEEKGRGDGPDQSAAITESCPGLMKYCLCSHTPDPLTATTGSASSFTDPSLVPPPLLVTREQIYEWMGSALGACGLAELEIVKSGVLGFMEYNPATAAPLLEVCRVLKIFGDIRDSNL